LLAVTGVTILAFLSSSSFKAFAKASFTIFYFWSSSRPSLLDVADVDAEFN